MNERMKKLREDMFRALDEERAKQMEEGEWTEYDRGLADGWVEALEYVLHQMHALDSGAWDLLSTQEYTARWLETHEDE